MAKNYPKISINYSLCTTPYDCKKCLLICPQAVFQVRPIKQIKFQETDKKEPGSFKLTDDYRDKCVVCNRCMEVCPNKALKIIY